MRFSNVDHKELHLFAEPALEFLQVPSLGTKRWSCVTAKDQRDRLRPRNEESRTLPSPLSNGSSKSGASLPTAGANVSRAAMNFIISARRSGRHRTHEGRHAFEVFGRKMYLQRLRVHCH
jgi:hypothetical protein